MRPQWSVRWRDGTFRSFKAPRWWRLVCTGCRWEGIEVDRHTGPAALSQRAVADLWAHMGTHRDTPTPS